MMKNKITIRAADWSQDKTVLSDIRRQVFINEQHVPEALEWDGKDASAFHLLALMNDKTVATGRLLSSGQIGRMAVIKKYRQQGIGKQILHQLLHITQQNNISPVWLNAQVTAISFYQYAGFISEGGIFNDAGIPHQRMILGKSL